MDRRDFMKSSAFLAAAGAVAGTGVLSNVDVSQATDDVRPGSIRNSTPGMRYRPMGTTGEMVSAIGFGMMRPPMLPSGEVDETSFKKMVRYAIDSGLNYIDTSHVYSKGKNQSITGRILGGGYRERVYLATKMPWWQVKKAEDFERILEEQLEALQTDYIDFYLMHAITLTGWNGPIRELRLIDKLEQAKARGKVRHIGFSHHAPLTTFKDVLAATPNWEFFQLQMNYIDAEYEAGLTGIKYAFDRGMGVIAMEPLRGGFLADMPKGVKEIFAKSSKKRSDVEWAFDYLWDMREVSMVLSGMSAMQHVTDNLEYAGRSAVDMLSADDRKLIAGTVQHLRAGYGAVPCTGCEYCHQVCQEKVAVAQHMIPWNQYKWNGDKEAAKRRITFVHGSTYGNGMQACVECGKCTAACPQGIAVPAVVMAIQ